MLGIDMMWYEDSSSFLHLLHFLVSERPMICRYHLNMEWPFNNLVIGLQCQLSMTKRSLDSLSESAPMKSFDCLIYGVAAQCLECLSFSYTLPFSQPKHDASELAGLEPQLDPSLAKALASSLPWIPQWPGT
jgi:hypothetical protein